MSGEFLDTNVLLYAHDRSAGAKREQAIVLSWSAWSTTVWGC